MTTRLGYNVRLALLMAACCAILLAMAPANASATVSTCKRFAAPPPTGSASGSGTKDSPYGSVQQLVNSLAPGDIGCLAPDATFSETVTVLNRPGTADKPFIVRSEDPGRPATISAASDAATQAVVYIGTTASHFELLGVNVHALSNVGTPAITIAGDSNAVDGGDITNPGNGTCVQIGPSPDRRATGARLDGDAIHSCGNPSGGHADGVGISYADGTQVTNSYFYGSPRHGITLFPDAQRSSINHNVIGSQRNGMGDGEGVQFAGDGATSSSNNVVEANLITDNEHVNIGFNWNDGSGTPGTGNVVRGNCISNSANTSGEFETDATTHQPVGYSQEGNTVGSDPQYLNRDAPPAGYALTPTSPAACRGLGPLAVAATDPVLLPPPDPEGASVFTGRLVGDINPHLQGADFHFEFGPGPGALSALPDQQIGPVGMPMTVLSQTLTGLSPSSTYSYRVVPTKPAGSAPGQTLTFTTAPAPKLTPPVPTISYAAHVVKRKKRVQGVSLPNLTLKNVDRGARVTVRCSAPRKRCPFPERKGASAIRLLRQPPFGPGSKLYIEVDPPAAIGRYRGRATTITIGRVKPNGQATVTKGNACVLADPAGALVPCLTPFATIFRHHAYATFDPSTAVGVHALTTVKFVCVHGKCPRFPACRTVASGTKTVPLLPRGQRIKAGVTFQVRFLKRDTRGLAATFTVHRARSKRGKTNITQTNSFLPAVVQQHGQCRDA